MKNTSQKMRTILSLRFHLKRSCGHAAKDYRCFFTFVKDNIFYHFFPIPIFLFFKEHIFFQIEYNCSNISIFFYYLVCELNMSKIYEADTLENDMFARRNVKNVS